MVHRDSDTQVIIQLFTYGPDFFPAVISNLQEPLLKGFSLYCVSAVQAKESAGGILLLSNAA